jgi:hypothetical protein
MNDGPSHLRCLAFVATVVTAAFCQSRTALADGIDLPPRIVNFQATKGSNGVCVVSGIVIDDDVSDITVQLGGYFPTVIIYPAADGSFSYMFYLPPGQGAYIAGLASEPDGEQSQPVQTFVVGSLLFE